MTNMFWNSPTYRIIQAMKATGNQPGVIAQWKDAVERWARADPCIPDALAVLAWLPMWQVRPFYTAAELAPIFPVLAVALGIVTKPTPQMSPMRLAFHLDYGGLPKLTGRSSPSNFRNPITGEIGEFYIVERLHHWRDREMSQDDFEREFCGV